MTSKNNSTVYPVDDYIIVKRMLDEQETHTPIDEVDQAKLLRGAVVARGPGVPTMSGERMGMQVLAESGYLVDLVRGDGVMYQAQAASELTLNSGQYDLVRFRDLVAVLKADEDAAG